MAVAYETRSGLTARPAGRDEVLEVDLGAGLVRAGSATVHLSVKEFGLLSALIEGQGRVMSREELYQCVWGARLRQGDRTIDVYVRRIRVKLAQAVHGWEFIHTHVGFGYRFAAEQVHS